MNLNYPQRRIFRGRGGATDRRLPKENARRRRQPPPSPRVNKYEDVPIHNNSNNNDDNEESSSSLVLYPDDDGGVEGPLELVPNNEERPSGPIPVTTNEEETTKHSAYTKEIKHLKRRIRNVREVSIQLSRDAIASDVTKYRDNVLNATQNCVNEWRSIARHYGSKSEQIDDDNDDNDNYNYNSNDDNIPAAVRTEVGLAVFQLIQLSIQCGPLSGAKPGYFKRCGSEVAKVVLDFLEEIVPNQKALGIDRMGFSSKQLDAMNTWKSNAQKAVLGNKPPSKSVAKKLQQKQQHAAPTKSTKKKKKKQ